MYIFVTMSMGIAVIATTAPTFTDLTYLSSSFNTPCQVETLAARSTTARGTPREAA